MAGVVVPDGHGFGKIFEGGEPGEILNKRVVANVPRSGEEKSNLRKLNLNRIGKMNFLFYLTNVLFLSRKIFALVDPPKRTSQTCNCSSLA